MKSALLQTLALTTLSPLAFATVVNDSVPYRNGGGELQMQMWYPEESALLRGVLVMVPGQGSDARGAADEAEGDALFKEVARKHGFALMGLRFTSGNAFNAPPPGGWATDCSLLWEGLVKIAKTSGHPELTEVPRAVYGFSNGGGYAVALANLSHKNTIAFVNNKGESYKQIHAGGWTAYARKVPGLICYGENDISRVAPIKKAFAADRAEGARWEMIPDYGQGHFDGGYGRCYASVFLDRMIELRLPKDWTPGSKLKLVALDEAAGWLGNNASTESALAQVHAPGSPEAQKLLEAQKSATSWFATEELSWHWRAIATRRPNVPGSVSGAVSANGFAGALTASTNRAVTLRGGPQTVWYTSSGDGKAAPLPRNADGVSTTFLPSRSGVYPLWAVDHSGPSRAAAGMSPLKVVLAEEPKTFSLRIPARVLGSSSTKANLQVRAADRCRPLSEIIFTWSTVGEQPAPVDFSVNGTNAACDTKVTFRKAGTYRFKVTLQHPNYQTLESAVTVTVSQATARLTVEPASPRVVKGGTVQFSAAGIDQFGDPMQIVPTWKTTIGGNIDAATGRFTAGDKPCIRRVTATANGKARSTLVTVVNP